MSDAIATVGDNFPPPDLKVGGALRESLVDLNVNLARRRDDLIAAEARMPLPSDDDSVGKIGDFIKLVTACMKTAETTRVSTKEPYLEGSRLVDGYFKGIIEPLDKLKKRVEKSLSDYLRAKADDERRRREEFARIEREHAEQLARDAKAREAAIQTEQQLETAIHVADQAQVAAADAAVAEKAAEAKPAEMARTRGDLGSVSTLRTSWDFEGLERATLDLEALRQHLPTDGLERAIRSFIRAGGRELRGTTIYEKQTALVR